jgi:hypothetical protein
LALLDYARERVARTLGLAPSARADRLLISAAVLGLLAAAAEDRPTMAGPASADALVFTARQLRAERLAILFPARDGEMTMVEAPVFRS